MVQECATDDSRTIRKASNVDPDYAPGVLSVRYLGSFSNSLRMLKLSESERS